jgi:hypothetical protein
MQVLLMRNITCGALIALCGLLFTPVIYAQGAKQPPPAAQPARPPSQNVSDAELQTFAKAYIEVQEIRASHEAALRTVQNPEQARQLQQDANVKMVKAVEKQGLTPEQYTRILTAVNSDEKLTKKVRDLVAKEKAS